jgi:hypothetical protein
MSPRSRVRRLTDRFGPQPAPIPELTHEERINRLLCWIGNQTYNRGIFDADPEFRPAWSHYHDLWRTYTHAWCPLTAVWVTWQQPDFEAARRRDHDPRGAPATFTSSCCRQSARADGS